MRLVLIQRPGDCGMWELVREFDDASKAMRFWAGRFSHPVLCVVTIESAREDYGVRVPS